MSHKFNADFVVFGNVILEVKAVEGGFTDTFTTQVLNYLALPDVKLDIIKFWKNKIRIQKTYLLTVLICAAEGKQ